MSVAIRTTEEIEKLRAAGRVVAECHQRVEAAIAPGVTTADLDEIVRNTISEFGATSNFYGHHGFPGYICASVNEVVVHGIPGSRTLADGDIISVDVGAIVDGWHADSAWSYPVGSISAEAQRLLEVTEASLMVGISHAKPGNRIGTIGHEIERYLNDAGPYGIIREYGGHGIGRAMWEEPHIPNWGDGTRGPALKAGMVLAIEPMVTLGGEENHELEDGWTVVTSDGSWSAHFEHTVAITADGPVILTARDSKVVQ